MQNKKKKLIEYNQGYILEAAKTLFQKNGVLKTTVDEIAKISDCSKATIYVYFKNKDDIYYHIVLEYFAAMREEIKANFLDAQDYKKAYFSMCDTLVKFEENYPMYFECVLGKISVEPEKMSELPVLKEIFDVGEEINSVVCEFLEKAKANGIVRTSINPKQATFVLWSGICGVISLFANKRYYFENIMGIKREDFFKNSFAMILSSIMKEGE